MYVIYIMYMYIDIPINSLLKVDQHKICYCFQNIVN